MNWRTPLHLSTVAMLRLPLARLVFGILGLIVMVTGIWALASRGSDAGSGGLSASPVQTASRVVLAQSFSQRRGVGC